MAIFNSYVKLPEGSAIYHPSSLPLIAQWRKKRLQDLLVKGWDLSISRRGGLSREKMVVSSDLYGIYMDFTGIYMDFTGIYMDFIGIYMDFIGIYMDVIWDLY